MNTEYIGNAPLSTLQRKARRRARTLTLIGAISLTVLFVLAVLEFSELKEKSYKKRIDERDVVHAGTLRNQKGLPATVENLSGGTVYFVSAVLSNQRPDETEHFAVLHNVNVVNIDDYRHSREERFFNLPFPLEPHKYYQFFRSETGKIARAEEYPPPTPPKFELRYK